MDDAKKRAISEMSEEEVFLEVKSHQITALMFHAQMADLFDFLGLHWFKRLHEYQGFAEALDYRKICRYYLNHHNKLLIGVHPTEPDVIPADWAQYTRFDVTPQVRRQAVEKAFTDYREWEHGTKQLYSHCVKTLMERGCVACAQEICKLVCDVDHELKCLDRLIIKLKAISYDAVAVVEMQDAIHEHYRKKTEELELKF